ncbi:hypothetical protein TRVL_01874 [Trypanosoma vivax]|nr:hypothetical protein TRVL_01874 [Trypanosoma vivax]
MCTTPYNTTLPTGQITSSHCTNNNNNSNSNKNKNRDNNKNSDSNRSCEPSRWRLFLLTSSGCSTTALVCVESAWGGVEWSVEKEEGDAWKLHTLFVAASHTAASAFPFLHVASVSLTIARPQLKANTVQPCQIMQKRIF